MKIIEVPVFNEDGSVKLVQQMSPEEAQHVLQFALNFLMTSGLAATYMVGKQQTEDEESQLDLFDGPTNMQ
jgi:hypothetical protein